MTVSTHVYTATLKGAPDRALSVRGGRISLDAGAAPHVDGSLDIALPDAVTLAALDPRLGPRVVVHAEVVTLAGTQSRTFDLGLRERDVRHRDGVVSLQLASDEALLTDYAPLADDVTPFSIAASLRAVVNYVLGKAIPGAALAASPNIDANMTPYWTVTNLVTNPRADDATGYLAAGGTSAVGVNGSNPFEGTGSVVWNSSTATESAFVQVPNELTARAGEVYTASMYMRSNTLNGRTGRILIRFTNDAGTLMGDFTSNPVPVSQGSWTRLNVTVTTPVGATKVYLFARQDPSAAGQQFALDAPMLYRDKWVIPFFHGNTVDAHYVYGWGPNGSGLSVSTRTPVIARDPEALVWKAGQTALDFLAPLVQAAGFRLVCDESRVWTLRSENYSAPGALSIRHGVNLVDGSDTIHRDTGVWFDAAVTEYTWTDRNGIAQRRIDAYASATPYTRLTTFTKDTAYPGAGFSQYAVRRAKGRGREVSASAVSEWTARAEQPVTIVLAGAPTQTGQTIAVEFDLDRDEMTVRTRTTDTPAGAIDLLAGTIDALTGTIDSL